MVRRVAAHASEGWCHDELTPRAELAAGTADLDALLVVVALMNWCDALVESGVVDVD
jgi:hypothetical protein